jgi:hypothetical protein
VPNRCSLLRECPRAALLLCFVGRALASSQRIEWIKYGCLGYRAFTTGGREVGLALLRHDAGSEHDDEDKQGSLLAARI